VLNLVNKPRDENIIPSRISGSGEGKDLRGLSEKEMELGFNCYKHLLLGKT
jgi:hypothetical protein